MIGNIQKVSTGWSDEVKRFPDQIGDVVRPLLADAIALK